MLGDGVGMGLGGVELDRVSKKVTGEQRSEGMRLHISGRGAFPAGGAADAKAPRWEPLC